ncbi:IS66 family insertion sequence element accessory protein TnpA [Clostridium thermarum]|uniref:IS66 family insertion sequence element accessory protein TnpA n=1 Tax=Clostridium thermarum TaxID=1716543 RepID=UPI00111DEE3A|nr:hypothetical protein [Clostridium thermarum]
MSRRLDNATWEEYINKFDACNGTITVKDFCLENKLTKSQFYYHKRRVERAKFENKETVFHAISLDNKENNIKENIYTLNEVKITIGNTIIAIPVNETALISSIIKELAAKC